MQTLTDKIKKLPKPIRDAIRLSIKNLEAARNVKGRLKKLNAISDAEWEAAQGDE